MARSMDVNSGCSVDSPLPTIRTLFTPSSLTCRSRLEKVDWSIKPRFRKPKGPALSTCALIRLHCHLVSAISRISLGGDDHVAGHDLCPLRQGASDLCNGPSCPGAAFRCATLR